MGSYSAPPVPDAPPPPPSESDVAIRNAKLQERRRQLGLQGIRSTFLTMLTPGGDGGRAQSSATPPTTTVLGG